MIDPRVKHRYERPEYTSADEKLNLFQLTENDAAAASLDKSGVRYRVRFVYKSHLPVQMAHSAKYGCVFCIQQGHGIHEGDGNVIGFQAIRIHPCFRPRQARIAH